MRTLIAAVVTALFSALLLPAGPAGAVDEEDLPWSGTTCEAAITTRTPARILLEDDVYPLPGLRVSDPLATYTGSKIDWKRRNRIAQALPNGDGTAGSGGFTLQPGQTLGLVIPCLLIKTRWNVPPGLNDRPVLYVERIETGETVMRDLQPVWVEGTHVVRRARNDRGDALFEIK